MGCGCRGRELGAALVRDGHAVRGTSRTEAGAAAIERAGFEGVVADPDRMGTLMAQLEGVSVVAWLLGSAAGTRDEVAALHGPRLETLAERLVDTPVRGLVYEARGRVDRDLLDAGVATVERAARTWSMPVRALVCEPDDLPAWVEEARGAVAHVLSA